MQPVPDLEVVEEVVVEGLAWPTIDPSLAVSLLLQEAELQRIQSRPPHQDETLTRDLSPLGRSPRRL
jgi:hypothetical protein